MFSWEKIKESPELKALSRHYVAKLFLIFNGSVQTYLAVTQNIYSKEKKREAWDKYNELFNERILIPLLDVFDKNRCGIAEICTAVLRLLEIAGGSVAEVKQECDDEARTNKFWEERFAER